MYTWNRVMSIHLGFLRRGQLLISFLYLRRVVGCSFKKYLCKQVLTFIFE